MATLSDIALHFFQSAVEIGGGLGVILMRMRHLPDRKSKGSRIFVVGAGHWVGLWSTASCAWGNAQGCQRGVCLFVATLGRQELVCFGARAVGKRPFKGQQILRQNDASRSVGSAAMHISNSAMRKNLCHTLIIPFPSSPNR